MKSKKYSLDVVIPCYHEQETLPNTIPTLYSYLSSLIIDPILQLRAVRLILIDDGSNDDTWSIIEKMTQTMPIDGIKLSRNYGHQNAMLAGLTHSSADVVLTIDADLQDDIKVIKKMLLAYQNGTQLALGVRSSRGNDGVFKRTTAKLYYKFLSLLGVDIVQDHADFRLMTRKSIDALLAHDEVNLFLRGIIPTIGFSKEIIYYERQDREFGETKYTLKKMLNLALNGITSFSITPLRIVTALGAIVSFLAFLAIIWVLIVRVGYYGDATPGWASTLLPILSIGGIQLLSLGIVGEYIGKIYLEVKRRPRFIVDSITKSEK